MSSERVSTLVVTDLDRTLIYSAAAFELNVPDEDAPTLVTAEFHAGRPQSYLTLAAAELLWALPSGTLVPATTRTVAQYLRIGLTGTRTRYAVTSNGGHLLVDGRVDEQWANGIRARIAGAAPLAEVRARLQPFADQDWVRSVRSADELFCYLVAETAAMPDGFVDELRDWCVGRGWRVSVQGRKVYALPQGLQKSTAVQRVRELVGADTLLAAGDGILDADVLEIADAGIRPRHGELHDADWHRPHVTVTEASGIRAGEEMVRWYSARL